MQKFLLFILVLVLQLQFTAHAETTYQKPEPFIDNLLRSGSFGSPLFSWDKTALLKLYTEELPSIKYVAREQLKLAGVRFNPKNYTSISNYYYKKLVYLDLNKNIEKTIKFPADSILRHVSWSPDGKNIAVSVEKDQCHEIWLVSVPDLKLKKIPNVCLNSVLNRQVIWVESDELILGLRTRKQEHALKVEKEAPLGPVVLESNNQVSQNRTYTDLLKTGQDAKVFAEAIETQLAKYNLKTAKLDLISKPLLLKGLSLSPNNQWMLVQTLEKPFSFTVPYSLFATKTELMKVDGPIKKLIYQGGPYENISIEGVPMGPRSFRWLANTAQSYVYVEALDKGNWAVKADYRDEIYINTVISEKNNKINPVIKTESLVKLKNRFVDIDSFDQENMYLIAEYERDRKWYYGYFANRFDQVWKIRDYFSVSADDDYNDPGQPVHIRNKYGESVIAINQTDKANPYFYTSDKGSTPEGDRPYLKKINLNTLAQNIIFRSEPNTYEEFLTFLDKDFTHFATVFQTQTQSPQVFKNTLANNSTQSQVLKTLIFADDNPYKILREIKKEIITYKRSDGVVLSGILYYPKDYQKGKKYPAVIHAYPLEYTDAKTAGQTRGSKDTFSRPFHEDVIYLALRGYVVLDEAQMPIIGHPETKNDTFVEQLVDDADSAVKALDKLGLVDTKKIGVIGHSYGAFMVAHLLTHSKIFAAGIAKSGAYNRTLTPFGFQGERRPYWQAKKTYNNLSPFMDADLMKKPLLLMHGMADNNPGTFTLQSERYFEALKGQGANVKLVLLPEETHGYVSMESIEHTLYEIFNWFDTNLKN